MKKLLALILSLIILLGSIPYFTVLALTNGITRAGAVSWCELQLGQTLDFDGIYEGQCVDLTMCYYNYLGQTAKGNASAYISDNCPDFWERITVTETTELKAGDVAVYKVNANVNGHTTSSYGHVAIIAEDVASEDTTMTVYQQNYKKQLYLTKDSGIPKMILDSVIRPDFTTETVLSQPTVNIANTTDGIKLSFTAVQGASAYEIYKKSENSKYIKLDTRTNRSYLDTDVVAGTSYSYAVRAINDTSLGVHTQADIIRLTNPVVKTANTDSGVSLSWAIIPSAKCYKIYRKTADSEYKGLATTTALTYIDKTAQSGSVYTYAVRACFDDTKSSYTPVDHTYLAQPTVLTANHTSGAKIKWEKINGAKGYYVYRRAPDGKYTKIATVTKTSYIDMTAKSGAKYVYTVRAFNGKTLSSYKGTSLLRLVNPEFNVSKASGGIKISYSKVASAKGYYIYRKTASGSYKLIKTTNSLSYIDKTAKVGTSYTYAVRAYNGAIRSSYYEKSIKR